MNSILIQGVLPFILSALIVIFIMFIAERYGTKTGGIFGTLPSTIVIAFIFIAINKDVNFAARSVAVVPAELGVNVIFLFFFALLAQRSIVAAFFTSFFSWTILSILIFIFNLENIYISVAIYLITLVLTFFIIEKIKKTPSTGKVVIHYTPLKIALRGIVAGIIISIAVVLSNINAVLSGIFSVFPAILTSTMVISYRDHGPAFTAGMAKSMMIGISSVMVYSTSIYFLYPRIGIIYGTILAYLISIVITLIIFKLRKKLK
jgi:hypothetical protein